ncbi:MAG: hypothetical protein V1773_02090 [bacterium]
MKKFEIILIALSFILIGFLFFINKYFYLEINIIKAGSMLLMLNSLIMVFNSIQNSKRSLLVWSTAMFLTGVISFTALHFKIYTGSFLILPSVFFISSGVFFMLFIENTKSKLFLIISVAAICCSLFFIEFKNSFFVNLINQYMDKLLYYKGIIAFIVGWLLISSRRKK